VTSLALGLPPRHERLSSAPKWRRRSREPAFADPFCPRHGTVGWGSAARRSSSVPARAGAGAAGVLVAMGTERVLVTGLIRKEVARWPGADLLVATTPALSGRGGSLERVQKGLALFLDQANNEGARAAVVVGSVEAALDLNETLAKAGRVLKPVGLLAKLVASPAGAASNRPSASGTRRPTPGARVAWVDCGLADYKRARVGAPAPEATFRLRYYGDWIALKHAATVSMARQVVLIGASSQSLALARTRLRAGRRGASPGTGPTALPGLSPIDRIEIEAPAVVVVSGIRHGSFRKPATSIASLPPSDRGFLPARLALAPVRRGCRRLVGAVASLLVGMVVYFVYAPDRAGLTNLSTTINRKLGSRIYSARQPTHRASSRRSGACWSATIKCRPCCSRPSWPRG